MVLRSMLQRAVIRVYNWGSRYAVCTRRRRQDFLSIRAPGNVVGGGSHGTLPGPQPSGAISARSRAARGDGLRYRPATLCDPTALLQYGQSGCRALQRDATLETCLVYPFSAPHAGRNRLADLPFVLP